MKYDYLREARKRQPAVLMVEQTAANRAQVEKLNDALACMKKNLYPQLDICMVGFDGIGASQLQEFSLLEDVEMVKVPSAAEDAAENAEDGTSGGDRVEDAEASFLAAMMLAVHSLRFKMEEYDAEGVKHHQPLVFLLASAETLAQHHAPFGKVVNPASLMAFAADHAEVERPCFQIFSSADHDAGVLPYWLEWPLTGAISAAFEEPEDVDMDWLNVEAFYAAMPKKED